MAENAGTGVCRCHGAFNGALFGSFAFWWATIDLYYCQKCDGLTLELVSRNSERMPDRSLVDAYCDLPGGRSIIVLDTEWIESLAKIVKMYVRRDDNQK